MTQLKQVTAYILDLLIPSLKRRRTAFLVVCLQIWTLNYLPKWIYSKKKQVFDCHLNPFALLDVCQPRDSKTITLIATQNIFSS